MAPSYQGPQRQDVLRAPNGILNVQGLSKGGLALAEDLDLSDAYLACGHITGDALGANRA